MSLKVFYSRFKQCLHEYLYEKGMLSDILTFLEAKSSFNRLYIAGCLLMLAVYMVFGYFASLICNAVGFLYPAYASIHALETHNKDDDTKWLTYWVVFAFFSVIDFFADSIFRWFPFYWLAKIIFLVWCFAPSVNNGSIVIYNKLIRPVFLKNRQAIDSSLNAASSVASQLIENATKLANKNE